MVFLNAVHRAIFGWPALNHMRSPNKKHENTNSWAKEIFMVFWIFHDFLWKFSKEFQSLQDGQIFQVFSKSRCSNDLTKLRYLNMLKSFLLFFEVDFDANFISGLTLVTLVFRAGVGEIRRVMSNPHSKIGSIMPGDCFRAILSRRIWIRWDKIFGPLPGPVPDLSYQYF